MRWTEPTGDNGPLIVPLVLYQGAQPWQHEREFAELFTDVAPQWRWVPRFEHLLVDLAQQSAESVPGALAARLAQVAMMAAFRQAREELLESATRLMGELYRAMGFDEVTKHVEYVLATQPDEYRSVFVDALRRNVPGRGGDVMNYVEQLIERGRREGRQEGHVRKATAKESWRGRFEPLRDSWNGISHGRALKPPPASTRPPFGSSSDNSTLPTTAPTRSFHAEMACPHGR